jgi:D-sedoheptulose 7-phosphate isomerase
MINKNINNYLDQLNIFLENINYKLLNRSIQIIKSLKKSKKIIIVGNGGSSSIASHICVDFIKSCKIRAVNFNEYNLITCFANDFKHEYWVKEALKIYMDKGDLIILISSSGSSTNIVEAAKYVATKKNKLITFSGFKKENELSRFGDVNIWINSKNYNVIETAHYIFLLSIIENFRLK